MCYCTCTCFYYNAHVQVESIKVKDFWLDISDSHLYGLFDIVLFCIEGTFGGVLIW